MRCREGRAETPRALEHSGLTHPEIPRRVAPDHLMADKLTAKHVSASRLPVTSYRSAPSESFTPSTCGTASPASLNRVCGLASCCTSVAFLCLSHSLPPALRLTCFRHIASAQPGNSQGYRPGIEHL